MNMSRYIVSGSVKFDDGGRWEGEFVAGKPGGCGTHTYANGKVYRGEWEDGKPNGVGKEEYAGWSSREY